jgi:hypothetical protein
MSAAPARAVRHGSFLETAWSLLREIHLGRMNCETNKLDPAAMGLATQMAWLRLVEMLDIIAQNSRFGVDDDSVPWTDFPADFDVPEAEARAHVEALVWFDMLRETVDGCLALPDDLWLTPQHRKVRLTGWRPFVPRIVPIGRR